MSKNGAIWAAILAVPLVVILVSGWLIFSGPMMLNRDIPLVSNKVEIDVSCAEKTHLYYKSGQGGSVSGDRTQINEAPSSSEKLWTFTLGIAETSSPIDCNVKLTDPYSKETLLNEHVTEPSSFAFKAESRNPSKREAYNRAEQERYEESQRQRELKEREPAVPEFTCDGKVMNRRGKPVASELMSKLTAMSPMSSNCLY